nr:hypothetical protein [Streptomyces phytophilus]
MIGHLVEGCRLRLGGEVCNLLGEFVAAGAQSLALVPQAGEPLGEEFFFQGAVFEGGEVAVDGPVESGELGLNGGELGSLFPASCQVLGLGAVDRLGDELPLVAVEAAEGVEDGGLQRIGVDARGVAPAGVVAAAAVAGVVAIDLGLAVGPGTDEGLLAVRAAHEPGELVVRAIGRPVPVGVAAGGEELLCLLERLSVDQGRVAAGSGDRPEGDLAEIDAVGQRAQHLIAGPSAAGAGGVASLVEPLGDGLAAEPVVHVHAEDRPDDGNLDLVGHEVVRAGIDEIADGPRSAHPLAGGGLAFHPGDDAVDDGVALELGEHAQHLHQHPAHGGGGVERLGGGAEDHPGLVEFIEQGDHVAQVPGEAVHTVDQQHVDQSGPRGGHRLGQPGAVGGGAGGVVVEALDQPPAGLGVDVAGQAGILGFDGVGLVLIVGGAADVDPHPHVLGHRAGGGMVRTAGAGGR